MKIIYTPKAPDSIGPYSQAICKEGKQIFFLSGQIALDTSKNLQNKNIEEETTQILKNIEAILEKAELKKNNIVKAEIFMTNLDDFKKVNKIYESFLEDHEPARTVIGVNSLPKNANIEITITAIK